VPYNKKLTDLNRSGNTGKCPTSGMLYWPCYRPVNTARPQLDIFPYCPHSRSVSYYYWPRVRAVRENIQTRSFCTFADSVEWFKTQILTIRFFNTFGIFGTTCIDTCNIYGEIVDQGPVVQSRWVSANPGADPDRCQRCECIGQNWEIMLRNNIWIYYKHSVVEYLWISPAIKPQIWTPCDCPYQEYSI
jgi:hypothetical protein